MLALPKAYHIEQTLSIQTNFWLKLKKLGTCNFIARRRQNPSKNQRFVKNMKSGKSDIVKLNVGGNIFKSSSLKRYKKTQIYYKNRLKIQTGHQLKNK